MTRDLFVCVPWLVTYSYVCHDSWLIRMCAMTRDLFVCVPWLVHVYDTTRSHVYHDSFMLMTWLLRRSRIEACHTFEWSHIWMSLVTRMNASCHTFRWVISHTWTVFEGVWYSLIICVPWLIHVCVVTDSNVWLIRMCDMTNVYVCHDPFTCETWLIQIFEITHHMSDMTNAYVWHRLFMCVTWLSHACTMLHSYVWHDSFIRVS